MLNRRSQAHFLTGAKAPWEGFLFLNEHPHLWRYTVLPVLLNLLITGLVLTALVLTGIWFFSVVHPWFATDQSGFWWWLAVTGEVVAGLLFLLAAGFVAVLTYKLLSGILCGYFHGVLAEQVERELGVAGEELRSISFVYEAIDTAINLALIIFIYIVCLVVSLFPVLGGAIALIAGTLSNWFLLGLDQLSFPLALRGVRRIKQLAFARRHREATLGLGMVVFLFEFVPVIGALFLTTSVVGAVLLHRRLQAELSPTASSQEAFEQSQTV